MINRSYTYDTARGKNVSRIVHESDNPADIRYAEYKEMLIKASRDADMYHGAKLIPVLNLAIIPL